MWNLNFSWTFWLDTKYKLCCGWRATGLRFVLLFCLHFFWDVPVASFLFTFYACIHLFLSPLYFSSGPFLRISVFSVRADRQRLLFELLLNILAFVIYYRFQTYYEPFHDYERFPTDWLPYRMWQRTMLQINQHSNEIEFTRCSNLWNAT
jgi:hypothetical protein